MNTFEAGRLVALAAALAAAGLAAGCASSGGAREATAKDACAQRYTDARLAPIRDKMVLPISLDEPQPIEVLANRSTPTAQEREAIKALSEIRQQCDAQMAREMGAPPAYRVRSQDEITEALSDLYAGEITYGQFAKSVLHIGDRDKAAREDIELAIRQRERWRTVDAYN
jgi:hypothetical protein